MATYNCIPSAKTVPPCPSGSAPDAVEVVSMDTPENYAGSFDHIPIQDLQVGVSMVLALIIGIMTGRR